MRPKGLSRLKIPMTSSGIEDATFRLEDIVVYGITYSVLVTFCSFSGDKSVAENLNCKLCLLMKTNKIGTL